MKVPDPRASLGRIEAGFSGHSIEQSESPVYEVTDNEGVLYCRLGVHMPT